MRSTMPDDHEINYALTCIGLEKQFDQLAVLRGVNLKARHGDIVALLGPSGCGKTTTLRLIAGFETPDAGIIRLDGHVVADTRHTIPAEERRVGMVFQEYALFPHLNVADNVAFGLRGSARNKQARVGELLDLVGLSGLDKRMPHELSGGQQQRVALARALAPQPRILLLDEPFSNLDTALRSQVRTEVKTILGRAEITSLLVTHDQEEALSLADEIAVMFDGQIAQMADAYTLYRQPATRAVAAFVGEANFIAAEASGFAAESSIGRLVLDSAAHGHVDVLIRPEQVQLRGDGVDGQVLWREFYGHDQRIGVMTAIGQTIIARTDSYERYTPGQQVKISVVGAGRAFAQLPATTSTASPTRI
jgi:iron(III) transport system ATP-binding protein